MRLKDLVTGQNKYAPELLRDAADLLYRNQYIDLWENQNDRIDIEIMALPESMFDNLRVRLQFNGFIKSRDEIMTSFRPLKISISITCFRLDA